MRRRNGKMVERGLKGIDALMQGGEKGIMGCIWDFLEFLMMLVLVLRMEFVGVEFHRLMRVRIVMGMMLMLMLVMIWWGRLKNVSSEGLEKWVW